MQIGTLTMLLVLLVPSSVLAQPEERIAYVQALARARIAAPDIAVAHRREELAQAEVGVAGVYANPVFLAGTATQTARVSLGVSLPLVVFGQRGASIRASEADLATVRVDSEVTWKDVRASTAHAFVFLWAVEQLAIVRTEASGLAQRLETAVVGRVEVGAAPEVEALRVRAERLRAEADAAEAAQLVAAAAADLGHWLGHPRTEGLRAAGEPSVPLAIPQLAELVGRIATNPSVRRENADARAFEAHAEREKALVRPNLVLDLGADVGDPTLPATNYRAQIAVDVPLFHQRGAYVQRGPSPPSRSPTAPSSLPRDASKHCPPASFPLQKLQIVQPLSRTA
jgi:outer membrane protein TolC